MCLCCREAGIAGKYYTRPYLRELETHHAFCFSFLIKELRLRMLSAGSHRSYCEFSKGIIAKKRTNQADY
jgi:hypothetical protein